MDSLRDEIVAMLEDRCHELAGDSKRIADAILSIPEIREALAMRERIWTGLRRYGHVEITGLPTAPESSA